MLAITFYISENLLVLHKNLFTWGKKLIFQTTCGSHYTMYFINATDGKILTLHECFIYHS